MKTQKPHHVPTIAEGLLYVVLNKKDRDVIIGDFEELYTEIKTESGLLYAYGWYWIQVWKSVPRFIMNFIYWRVMMLTNYIKIALRSLSKHKAYSLINITGLALGLAIFTLFAVIAGFDTNADKFHKNASRIFSVIQVFSSENKGEEHTAFTPAPLLPALINEFPELEKGARAFPVGKLIVKHDDHLFYENKMLFVDPDFLSIFSFEMISGNPATVLVEPNSIVLTKDAAFKYFGDEHPVGKTMLINNRMEVTVTGILKNPDEDYSSIKFDFLVSMKTARNFVDCLDDWNVNRQVTFLLLNNVNDAGEMKKKLPGFVDKHIDKSRSSLKRMYLLSLLDFRLKSEHITSCWVSHGSFTRYLVLIVGFFVLFIVCINYMNLSTARYMNRVKEVGIRKVVGAKKLQLIRQFLSESVIMSIIALPISLVFYANITTVLVRYVVGYEGDFPLWNHPFLMKYLLGVTFIVGIFAGSYPAFFLSSFKPAQILNGNVQTGSKAARLRKILVITQFGLAIILIVLTMTTKKVFDYVHEVDFGYERERIVAIKMTGDIRDNIKPLRNALHSYADIISVTASSSLPGAWDSQLKVMPEGMTENQAWTINVYDIDYDFIETLGMTMVQGRSHSRAYDDVHNFIVNETMIQQLQWKNPVGKLLTIDGKMGTVIGVAKDFHFREIDTYITPTVLRLEPENLNYLLIKLSSASHLNAAIEYIKDKWQLLAPGHPFESITLNDYFNSLYKGDRTFITIFSFVDIIAIFISCLGLLGLSSYAVERRTKEIGIRRVLGASITAIVRLLAKEFVMLVILANVIALPFAYYLTNTILHARLAFGNVSIDANILLLTSVITLCTASIAVMSQILKAIRTNPVDSLKYE